MTDKLRAAAIIWWDRPCYKCRSHTCDTSCSEPRNIRAALAEPAIKESLTVAEPVAWMSDSDVGFYKEEFGNYPCVPLYAAPPRREWVGLTGDEIEDLPKDQTWWEIIRAAEEILKEKNT